MLSRLTKVSSDSVAYSAWRGASKLAINDQVQAELLGAGHSGRRKERLDDLVRACVKLPLSESTHVRYAQAAEVRGVLRKTGADGRDAGDNDVWIIASALEYNIPLLSHDKQQVHLARLAGVKVVTNLPELRNQNPPDYK